MTNQSSYENMFENFLLSVFKLFTLSIVYLLRITSDMPYLGVLGDKIFIDTLDAVNTEISRREID